MKKDLFLLAFAFTVTNGAFASITCRTNECHKAMNKAIILILLSMIVQICQGQETDLDMFENNYLQIRQKPGTDNLLRKYIAHAGCKEDTVYAFVYTPGLCPRCEGMLKTFHSELLSNNRKLLLISICPDDKVAKMYNKLKGYEAEYNIYDTGKECLNIFSFNRSALHGAYILKMTKKGRLLSGGDDNLMSSKFIQQLIARQTPLPYKNFEKEDKFIPDYPLNIIKEIDFGKNGAQGGATLLSPKAGDAFFLVVIMEVTFAGVRRDESRFYTDFAFYLHLQMLGDKNVAHGLGD